MKKAAKITSPQVVGTVHSPEALRQALRLKPGAVDLLELRLDHFASDPSPLLAAAPRLAFPCIITARHPAEGGLGRLSAQQRAALYRLFLPHAALLDVEWRSFAAQRDLLEEARAAGVKIIISQHYFGHTPSEASLLEKLAGARAAKADIFKVAARTASAADVARLLSLFGAARGLGLSAMGMGPLGKASRLLFARAGSLLNYGYLGEPQVSGQWSALKLKERLGEVLSDH